MKFFWTLVKYLAVVSFGLGASQAAVWTSLFGRSQPGGPVIIQDLETHPGTVRFVDASAASAANALGGGQSPNKPFSTLAYVLANASSLTPALAAGDIIYVMPGHTESLSSAAAIACATAGVKIIGLGWGSSRPTFTWHTTDATWTVTAASVTIKNIRVTVDVDEVVSMFSVTAAFAVFDAVDYVDATTTQAIQFLLTTNAADYIEIRNCRHYLLTAPAANSKWIQLVGPDGAYVHHNYLRLVLTNNSASVAISLTTDGPACEIAWNVIVQTGGTSQTGAIILTTGTGAFVHDNRCAVGSTALPGIVAVGSAGYGAENYALNTANVSGLLDPVADS